MIANNYRQYKEWSQTRFAVDCEKARKEERYDGKWVLRTSTQLSAKDVALKYKQLWMAEDICFIRLKRTLPRETRFALHASARLFFLYLTTDYTDSTDWRRMRECCRKHSFPFPQSWECCLWRSASRQRGAASERRNLTGPPLPHVPGALHNGVHSYLFVVASKEESVEPRMNTNAHELDLGADCFRGAPSPSAFLFLLSYIRVIRGKKSAQ